MSNEPKFEKAMPLPTIRLTKLKAKTEMAIELENKSDGCIIKTLNKPAMLIETLGAIPTRIIIYQKDLKEFLKSTKRKAEYEI